MAALVGTRTRGARIGIAISPQSVCAAIRRPGQSRVEAWRASLAPLNGDSAWPGLTEALRLLARDTGIQNGRLTVALMPPLAEARGVDVPPVGDHELQQLLARGAGKFFVAARGAQVVGAVRAPRKSADTGTVAAAAASRVVNAIHDSARAAGWSVEAVIPAEAAWGIAAARWAPRGRSTAQLLIAHPDRTDLLRIEQGRLVELRRFRGGASDAALIADAFAGGAGYLGVAGNLEARRELTRQLSARGLSVEAPPTALAEVTENPDLLAAAYATPDAAPALVTDAVRAERAMAMRRVAQRVAIAAGVLLVAAALFEWWGLKRELGSIRAQRASIAPQISLTLVGRNTVENTYRQLAMLSGEERAAPRWSSTIAALSERLPTDAFLTGFRGRGDSISIDGLASDAARVFDAVEKVPVLEKIRASGQVRIEKPDDGPPLQRFAIAGLRKLPPGVKRVEKPKSTKPVAPPTARGGGR